MSFALTLITAVALAALTGLLIWRNKKEAGLRRRLAWQLAALAGFIAVLYFVTGFPVVESEPVSRSGEESSQVLLLAVLFVFTVLGMVSFYLYERYTKPASERPAFDLGLFLAPVLLSPIIFAPLLSAFSAAGIDLQELTTPRLMMFLVAYEQGFFWKAYFTKLSAEPREVEPLSM